MKKLLIYFVTAVFLSFGFSNVTSAAGNTYTVKKGDTLWAISKKHNVTVQQIKSWNNLKSDTIKPNQVLKVTAASAPKKTTAKAAKDAAASHIQASTLKRTLMQKSFQ